MQNLQAGHNFHLPGEAIRHIGNLSAGKRNLPADERILHEKSLPQFEIDPEKERFSLRGTTIHGFSDKLSFHSDDFLFRKGIKKVTFVAVKKILVIDNYDSFVHNAVQLLRESSEPVNITIQLNDRIDFEKFGDYDGVLLSPGPGIPEEAGDLMAAIGQIVRQRIPVLGICLGHQALARAFGAELRQLSAPLHGHPTTLTVTDAGDLLLQKVAPPLIVGRYHSWIVDPDSMPEELIASSHDETGHIMSFYHRNLPIHGVQFHPESCISNCGSALIRNWLATCCRHPLRERSLRKF